MAASLFALPAEATDEAARRHLELGRLGMLAADFEGALVELEIAAKEAASPQLAAEIHREKGVIESALDRYTDALASFVRALELAPETRLDPDESGDLAVEIFECARSRPAAIAPVQPGQPFRCPTVHAVPPAIHVRPSEIAGDGPSLRTLGMGAGAAALVAGGVFALVALTTRSDLEAGIRDGQSLVVLEGLESRGKTFAITADVLVVTGVVIGTVAWLSD